MPGERERKRDPHHCTACGAAYDVAYFDDRRDQRQDETPTLTDVPCPRCGKAKSISLPAGAERTVVVEPSANQADIGGSD